MAICRECPLYNKETDKCDSKRCINKETGEVTDYPDSLTICGCGCYMKKKTKSKSSHCILNKW